MGKCETCGKETSDGRYCRSCRSKLFFGDPEGALPDCFDWEAGKAAETNDSKQEAQSHRDKPNRC